MTPLASIIIPCWNAEAYIGEAIESALSQTYPNFEVIIIDDGSTDESLDVIRMFKDRIKWKTGLNQGGGAARNLGLDLSSGALVQFLDADDLLYPRKLEKMVPLTMEKDTRVVPICDWERVGKGDQSNPEVQKLDYDDEDPILFCLRRQLPTSSPLHWKDNLTKVGGFDESLPCSQERDLHLRLACHGVNFTYLPEVLYRVRRQQNSTSCDYGQVLRQHGKIFSHSFKQLQQSGDLTEDRAEAFAETMARDARRCLSRGDASMARQYFQLAGSMSKEGALRAFGRKELRITARLFGPVWADRICQLALRFGLHA